MSIPALEELSCMGTEIRSLAHLAGLTALKSLTCSDTKIENLEGLKHLPALEVLDCQNTPIRSLAPLAGLQALKRLVCDGAQIESLEGLKNLPALEEFACRSTAIRSLAPLAGLTALKSLSCSDTKIEDLEGLKDLPALEELSCMGTEIRSLAPLEGLTAPRELTINDCHLDPVPERFWTKDSLQEVQAYKTAILDLPAELLSDTSFMDNCLPRIRAHLRDKQAGEDRLHDAKLMVLGNGHVGKTQLCRSLRNENFDRDVPSTHGIMVTSIPSPLGNSRIHIWDFGGQDIYHSTHSLFLRNQAIFLLLWTPSTKNSKRFQVGGIELRNFPLGYWLDFVAQFGRENSPVIVVQSQADEHGKNVELPETSQGRLGGATLLRFSAKTGRNEATLISAISDAHQRFDPVAIGSARARVKRKLEDMRDADAAIADPSCLIPRFDGVIHSLEWKEALWDRFVTGAPRPRTPSERQYSDRKLRSRS